MLIRIYVFVHQLFLLIQILRYKYIYPEGVENEFQLIFRKSI